MIEEIKESALAMDRLLIQADKLLKNSFEKAKKRITNKKRREAIFLLNDSQPEGSGIQCIFSTQWATKIKQPVVHRQD